MSLRFGSVCSGIEAASVAWHPLGWSAAWLAEIEPFPCAVLAHHYPDVPNVGDMTTIPGLVDDGLLEAPDVFCGGTPCQAFSVAGLRRSLDDARGNLSLVFCEIADAIDRARAAYDRQPAIVFWENVPGVLNTKDNAFGCFLAGLAGEDEPLQPAGGRWSDCGVVLGPQRAVAWRVLDAQYFGLAQRRRRVFVVASARDDFDPLAVLLEFDGVRRDSAPSREAGEATAGGAAAGAGVGGGGGLGVASNAEGSTGLPFLTTSNIGKHVNNQTPLITIAHALRGEGFDASEDGTGRGTGRDYIAQPVAFHHNAQAAQLPTADRDTSVSDSLTCSQQAAVAIRTAQTGSNGWGINTEGTAYTLDSAQQAVAHPVLSFKAGQSEAAVAFSAQDNGRGVSFDVAPTMRKGGDGGGVQLAVYIKGAAIGRKPEAGPQYGETLTEMSYTQNCVDVHGVLTPTLQVRRLTPRECERLQGFPDDYTLVPYRKKPAADGPRYKALGNSWAVPVVRWIGQRIHAQVFGGLA